MNGLKKLPQYASLVMTPVPGMHWEEDAEEKSIVESFPAILTDFFTGNGDVVERALCVHQRGAGGGNRGVDGEGVGVGAGLGVFGKPFINNGRVMELFFYLELDAAVSRLLPNALGIPAEEESSFHILLNN